MVGFIVPVDARATEENHWSDYISTEELLSNISGLPANHILVILDSCHSGMALGRKFTTSRGDTRYEEDLSRKVSRKVIASAQGDQQAADGGPFEGHSLFTGYMIQGLTTRKAAVEGASLVTASQLGLYTQREVGVFESSRQTPMFGVFDSVDDGGELVIHLGAGANTEAGGAHVANGTAGLTSLESSEVAKIRSDRSYWRDDSTLKNFPAGRSGALKLCDSGDNWGCEEAAKSFRTGLGGGTDYSRAIDLARQACEADVYKRQG